MTKKSEYPHSPDEQKFLKQFTAEERKDIKKIWEVSPKASPTKPDVKQQEITDAMANINRRIDTPDSSQQDKNHFSNRSPWIWRAAAAAVLIIAVAIWLFIPRTVNVPNGEVAQVTLPDGSEVTLNSGSRLQYNPLYSYTNRTLRLNGEAFFSVRHGDHPFIIHTNEARVKVTGTKFNVRSWANDPDTPTEVTVVEGSVKFYRKNSKNLVKIQPGETSHITDDMKKPSPPHAIDIGRVLGWRSNKLIFNDRPLRIIFNELEHRFNVNIIFKDPEIGRQKLSAYYSHPSSAESVLKDICRVKGLHYAKTANGFRIFNGD